MWLLLSEAESTRSSLVPVNRATLVPPNRVTLTHVLEVVGGFCDGRQQVTGPVDGARYIQVSAATSTS
jgi:hypothetical protein